MTSQESRGGTYCASTCPSELTSRLCWLAFLVTEDWHLSLEVVSSIFDGVHGSFPRERLIVKARLVAAAAVAAIKSELPGSARRTEQVVATDWKRLKKQSSECAPLTKVALQRALLAIDIFPRCALLLTVLEGLSIDDAVLLLDESPTLVRGALGLALLQLTRNLTGSLEGTNHEHT
jgi:hypothetical protein